MYAADRVGLREMDLWLPDATLRAGSVEPRPERHRVRLPGFTGAVKALPACRRPRVVACDPHPSREEELVSVGPAARRRALIVAGTVAIALTSACGNATSSTSVPTVTVPVPGPSTVALPRVATTGATAPAATGPATGQAAGGSVTTGGQAATGPAFQTGDLAVGAAGIVGFDSFTGAADDGLAPLRVRVTWVAGNRGDLTGFQLDAQSRQGTPTYVSFELTNLAGHPLDTSGFAGRFVVTNGAGERALLVNLIGDFPKCEGYPPDSLPPGASAKGCSVFMLPQGQKVAAVSLFSGPDYAKLTWR
jgi:hypothetical protein